MELNLGTINLGGPIVTKGGLIFTAATIDGYLRALSVRDGKELWKSKLPAGGQTTPMTYTWEGRQYVVIYSGAHAVWSRTPGDYIVAYALAEESP